jgi:uncharacterized protein (TIGR02001 family)
MKNLKLALCAVAASVAFGGAAMAQDSSVAFNVAVTSDYKFRGVTQTNGDPALSAGVDVASGKAYFGAWASNVDFGDDTSAEIDVYGGYKPTVGAVTLDFGLIYYSYVSEPNNADYANWEVKAAASVPAGPATLGAAVYYSNDSFGAADEATYVEVNGAVPVGPVTISGAIGNQSYKGSEDYNTWNLGVSYTFGKVTLDGRYVAADNSAFLGDFGEDKFVATVKAAF